VDRSWVPSDQLNGPYFIFNANNSRFKEALNAPEDASDSDAEYIGDATTNRGNKLKRGARQVYRGKLGLPSGDGYGIKLVEYEGHKRPIIYKRRKTIYEEDLEQGDEGEEDGDEDEDEEENPYADIKLSDLLSPITHPSQLPTHPAISRTYTSETLRILARQALDTIVEEQKHVVKLSKLMAVFLGDDPSYLNIEKLNLPIYDDGSADDNGTVKEEATNGTVNEANGDVNGNGSGPATRRMTTRNQASSEMDPFFAPPQIHVDRDFGVSNESAEETRQLAQIVQQRMEEFVRSMVAVRGGLTRAQRQKRQVYRWCLEMAGEDDLYWEIGPDPCQSTGSKESSRIDGESGTTQDPTRESTAVA
jgi:hypothetical protein